MKIALTQQDQAWEDKQANLNACDVLAGRAAGLGADMIIFPEMTLTGFTLNTPAVAEPEDNSPSLRSLSEIAARHRIGLVAGLVMEANGQTRNCAVAFDKNGVELCRYAKVHPFTPAGESHHVTGGDKLAVFGFEGVEFGLTICYDLRFPVLWHALGELSDCIVNIANWPASRLDHWNTLLRARAIENQLFTVGVNRTGVDGNGLEYLESSLAFTPDGTKIMPTVSEASLLLVTIDRATVSAFRSGFPVVKDRRNDLYNRFLNGKAGS